MKATFRQSAPPASVFAPDSFARQIGSPFPCRIGTLRIDVTLVSVVVSDDGKYADITLDIPSGLLPVPQLDGLSIAEEDIA